MSICVPCMGQQRSCLWGTTVWGNKEVKLYLTIALNLLYHFLKMS